MLPRPSVHRTLHDVEALVSRAVEDLAEKGLRAPDGLKAMIRNWLTEAYQTGVEAQREAAFRHLTLTEPGRILLEPPAPAARAITSQ